MAPANSAKGNAAKRCSRSRISECSNRRGTVDGTSPVCTRDCLEGGTNRVGANVQGVIDPCTQVKDAIQPSKIVCIGVTATARIECINNISLRCSHICHHGCRQDGWIPNAVNE
jgi:hypothetical protein